MQSDLKTLEFDGIRRLLERLTFSAFGADAARNLEPAPSLAVARQMQAAVTAARRLADAGGLPEMPAVPDIRAALRQAAQAGAALSASALANVRQVMHLGGTLKSLVAAHPGLMGDVGRLDAPAELFAVLDAAVSAAGRLREDASPELVGLHGQYHATRARIESLLNGVMRDPALAGLFDAESRIHWHGVRGAVAVRTKDVERLKGVRRGTVLGGRDTLIEPIEATAHNNQLEHVSGKIDAQNQIVLRATTDRLREHLPALNALVAGITWVDLALAGGQLSAALNAAPPELVDAPAVNLDRAYHPQLLLQFMDRRLGAVKPLTVALDSERPMLLITGPNTGGKTVVLKTVGLLVTMAHCGLHLPSEGPCRVGAFTKVILDVGDKQSLHHHLSTFAGHVEILKKLLAEADAQSLVLLDELGTGTDPEEGAALAMAVLDELARRRVLGVVTTHLSPLKTFAERHDYLSNACMRFDFSTLSPTYELECGKAGESLGLIVAEKNGLPADLIRRARGYLGDMAKPA